MHAVSIAVMIIGIRHICIGKWSFKYILQLTFKQKDVCQLTEFAIVSSGVVLRDV